ncbi:MAG: mucoidy inhibitor MuiA family protein [Bacteroidales bacterium]|nr:mucoidy inhibitor MuiA family protein [Bacteroidales bacterium]
MKHLLIAIITLLPLLSLAQKVDTKINEVTVYKNGALISRSGKVNLKKGDNELTLVNLSTNLDPKSIRLGVGNSDVTIVSLLHEFGVETSEEVKKLREKNARRKDVISDSISILSSELKVINETKSLILENKKIGGDQGVTAEQLIKMTQLYKTELTNLETRGRKISAQISKLNTEQNTILQNEKIAEQQGSKKISTIKLKLSAPKDINGVNISLSYLIFDAKWTPYYEVRVADADQPLQLVYKARVNQNSNEKWDNVQLTLSSGDPSMENQKPAFETMYLPPVRRQSGNKSWTRPSSNLIFGTVCDEYGEPLPGVNVIEKGTNNGTITDLDGEFSLRMNNINNKIQFQFIGYESQEAEPGEKMQIYLKEEELHIEEVVVVGYGTKKNSGRDNARTASNYSSSAPRMKADIPLELKNTLAVNEFKIQIPYTIPADGQDYAVSMLTYSIPAEYKYATAPRFSKEVFLMAEVSELYQYSLLKGPATIYFNNIYQGESEIDPTLSDDTLKLSIGSDKMIAIDRQEIHSKTNKAIIGSSRKVTKTFETNIRNNKNIAVDIDLEDQYPIAKYSDIKVALTDNGGAEVNTQNGRLNWKIHLEPHESQKVKFSYEVKYPANQYNFNVE